MADKPLTVGSLFSGIGGLELGLERAGMRVVWQVEKDAFCRKVLAKHWPSVTRYEDVKDVGKETLEAVDLICGGFPCQDVSHGGLRAGIKAGTRSGLWHEYARIIRELRPRYVLVENVSGLLSDGMGTVLGELSDCGYDAEWSLLPACALGATHTRERVFVLAYPNGLNGAPWIRSLQQSRRAAHESRNNSPLSSSDQSARLENPSSLYRVANEVPARVERNTALGNAVYPDCAEWIGHRIVEADKEMRGAA